MRKSIVIVEDSRTMRQVMRMTLAGLEADVFDVASGQQALDELVRRKPDLVFIDTSLADIDGYELARSVKTQRALTSTAIVLLASQHQPYDDARGRQAGADAHVLKPFETEAVLSLCTRLLRRPKASDVPSADESLGTIPPLAAATPMAAAPSPLRKAPPLQSPARPGGVPAGAVPGVAMPNAFERAPAAPAMRAPALRTERSISSVPPGASGEPPVVETFSQTEAAPPLPRNGVRRPASEPSIQPAQFSSELAQRVAALGLTPEQIEGVLRLSHEVVERVVWEVVPELAEVLIREELHRLTEEQP